jgi:hypothetical protein
MFSNIELFFLSFFQFGEMHLALYMRSHLKVVEPQAMSSSLNGTSSCKKGRREYLQIQDPPGACITYQIEKEKVYKP